MFFLKEEDSGRGEVLTPPVSLIELAENPLDRRAMASLKKQLEIDQPHNKLLKVRCSMQGVNVRTEPWQG